MKLMLLYFADNDLCGRLNVENMPNQLRLELLASHLTDRKVFQDSEGEFHDIAEWFGVIQSGNDIIKVVWPHILYDEFDDVSDDDGPYPGGSIDLCWLPRTVTHFDVSRMDLEGQVATAGLPRNLVRLNVRDNKLDGSFHVEGLPSVLEFVDISRNRFSGPLHIDFLPQTMRVFRGSSNKFSGTLNFPSVKCSEISLLYLDCNHFHGTVDLLELPRRLKSLHIQRNDIQQNEVVVDGNFPLHGLLFDRQKIGRMRDSKGFFPGKHF
mmetsp:Transcript_19391/g.30376  ORF Transcript_19391/g.30376 Transcript_19391/m.30376 type:complete len:266 (-) Transcript_19391:790-1587(-)